MRHRTAIRAVCLILFALLLSPIASAKWKYFRDGNAEDSSAKPIAGIALMGGGGKQEPAFRFLCQRAHGGDFLVLRASGDDAYIQEVNKEMRGLCTLNSAATILFTDREDSDDPKLLQIIRQAESIFIAGGDQSNYVRFWQDTPVQEALNQHIAAGKPIGGSSAGLAILGEYSFSAMIDTVKSPEALANPYGNEITLSRDFLKIPFLRTVISDTHFVKRDRLGRLLVFMARILKDGWNSSVRSIALEENAAVLIEPDGTAKVVGEGPAYFLMATTPPAICAYKQPLTFSGVSVHKAPPGSAFDVAKWNGTGGDDYTLQVDAGVVSAKGSTHGIY